MNNRQILAIAAGMLSLVTGIFAVRVFWFSTELAPAVPEPPAPLPTRTQEFPSLGVRLTGPFTHKNLTVYLVHGGETLGGNAPLTLDEAMKRGLVAVHETGDVNELAVENVSKSDEVFVQAGDIVKGGQQDRVLAVDLIIPARSGRMPIDSFCVEQGRWTARGGESRTQFNVGGGGGGGRYVASKNLKLAAKHSKSQGEVWNEVAVAQDKLSIATNTNTASAVSRSSLPLTLENREVDADSGEYVDALSKIIDGKPDVVGFVMIVNGEINSSDIYGSAELFRKLWPKLLKAAAIEAVAESTKEGPAKVTIEATDIESFLANSANAAVTDDREVTGRVRMVTRESETSVLVESLDRGKMLHRNVILK